ncbi:MAG: hypothetical protein GTN40_00040, partial [Candidatus Aenigmarchaeota archaeon]|nr:hypothetical protein [Candidatus Aenigmarchaeota archaeon]
MNIHLILLPIVSTSLLFLGILTYFRDKQSATSKAFFFLTLSMGIWVFIGGYMTNGASFMLPNLTLWMKITFTFGYLMGASLVYLALAFPKRERSVVLRWYEKLWLFSAFVFIPLIPTTNLFLKESWFVGDHIATKDGPLIIIPTIWGVLSVLATFVILFLKYRRAQGLTRTQFKYVFLGIFLFGFLGATFNLVIPAFGLNQFLNFGLYAPIFLVSCISYAII